MLAWVAPALGSCAASDPHFDPKAASDGYYVPTSRVAYPGNQNGWCPRQRNGDLVEWKQDGIRLHSMPEDNDETQPPVAAVEQPIATHTPHPDFVSGPPAGLVLARCVVTLRGKTKDCCIIKGLDGYNFDFLLALGKWRYEPAKFHGEPVTVAHLIPIEVAR